jgi:hypothetical protein
MSTNLADEDSIKLTKQLVNQVGQTTNASNSMPKTRLGILQSENIKEKQVKI